LRPFCDTCDKFPRGSDQRAGSIGPPQTKQLVDAAFHYITFGFTAFAAEPGPIRAGFVNGVMTNPFVTHEIQRDGLVYQDDKIRVTAAENSHYAMMSPQMRTQMRSYSYRIETPHGVVVFTGDTGPSDAVVRLAAGADVLVTEVGDLDQETTFVNGMAAQNHWPAERRAAMIAHFRQAHLDEEAVGGMASKAQVRSVVLYHYVPRDPAAYVARVKENFSGPLHGTPHATVIAPTD
jgi:ribonuclease BN (tRNA processing enzyme)